MFEAVYGKTQGASHVKRSIPCEDYGLIEEDLDIKIFAVADGHGDSNCPRSSFGSEVACRCASHYLKDFYKRIRENNYEESLLHDDIQQNKFVRELIKGIFLEWTDYVNTNIENNPLSKEEIKGCDNYIARYKRGERLEHIYGTTLIAGLLTDKYLLLIQQGDGRCEVFDSYGNVSQPIPWDEKCFANVTTSMCDVDVINRCRYCVINLKKIPVIAVFAGTDGVEDSFQSMDSLHSYYRELVLYACQYGVKKLNSYLKETLFTFSEQGSGDDVTICGFLDVNLCCNYIEKFRILNKKIALEERLKYVEDRITSLNGMGKTDALQRRCGEAEKSFYKAEEKLKTAIKNYVSNPKKAKIRRLLSDAALRAENENDRLQKAQFDNREHLSKYKKLINEKEFLKKQIANLDITSRAQYRPICTKGCDGIKTDNKDNYPLKSIKYSSNSSLHLNKKNVKQNDLGTILNKHMEPEKIAENIKDGVKRFISREN